MTLPSISTSEKRSYQRAEDNFENRILNNKLIEIVQEMQMFAEKQKAEFDFYNFKIENEKYQALDAVEKRLVYQLFKNFFVPQFYTFDDETKKFQKKGGTKK